MKLAIPFAQLAVAISLVGSNHTWAGEPNGSNSLDVAKQLNDVLHSELQADSRKSQNAKEVDDAIFIRRVSLDITGKLPDADAIMRFVNSKAEDKRERLVERLLESDDFGVNWGRYWRDVIYYRRLEDRARVGATSTATFFEEQLNKNVSWKEIAEQMITAEGSARDNGATGLIMAQMGMPEETVSEISRVFMGIQIQCAQCHDHPTDRWTREQFHELAAFFPRTAARPNRDSDRRDYMIVSNDNFRSRRRGGGNNNNRYQGSVEHYMSDLEDPQAKGTKMQPVFFVSQQTLPFGASDADRRSSLADWVTSTDNEWFSKAFVNRVWKELVGEGFYEPIDDIGPDRTCNAPQTLDLLSQQFTENGYDIKWLFQTIMATEVYQLQAKPVRKPDEAPFTANRVQRMTGDQIFDAIQQVLSLEEQMESASRRGRRNRGGNETMMQMRQRNPEAARTGFNTRFGYDPSLPAGDISGSIPQVLAMMNSQILDRLLSSRIGPLRRIAGQSRDPEAAIEKLYLQILARTPTRSELKTCLKHIESSDDRMEGFEDLAWTLMNSAEFIHRY